MDFLISNVSIFGKYLIANHSSLSFAITATVLVVFGEFINGIVRRGLRPYNILIRFLGFMTLCTFGYGFLAVVLSRSLSAFIITLTPLYAAIFVMISFLVLAIFANKNKQV